MIHVYCMPGLAANPSIFDGIALPEDDIKIHRLKWLLPKPKEDLKSYSKRMCQRIRHDNPVLIGVSFGGVIVQEMAQFIAVRRVIIISSVKSEKELPKRMRIARRTGAFRLLPTSLAGHLNTVGKLAFGEFVKKRVQLYQKYMSITDIRYLDWAIEKMVCWDRPEPYPGIVHIHGDQDIVFPYRYIGECITVPGGTHIMIINRFRWFNEYLGEIIKTGELKNNMEHNEKE